MIEPSITRARIAAHWSFTVYAKRSCFIYVNELEFKVLNGSWEGQRTVCFWLCFDFGFYGAISSSLFSLLLLFKICRSVYHEIVMLGIGMYLLFDHSNVHIFIFALDFSSSLFNLFLYFKI